MGIRGQLALDRRQLSRRVHKDNLRKANVRLELPVCFGRRSDSRRELRVRGKELLELRLQGMNCIKRFEPLSITLTNQYSAHNYTHTSSQAAIWAAQQPSLIHLFG
ncbi:hypothetical protein NHF46_10080 [Arthrobacter alpinus]|nr:hypothetical protein [Arthrobacter alpinus]